MWCQVLWCDVWCDRMWCAVMCSNAMWCDVLSPNVISCDVLWSDVKWCNWMGRSVAVMLYGLSWGHVTTCDVVVWCGELGDDVLWTTHDSQTLERSRRNPQWSPGMQSTKEQTTESPELMSHYYTVTTTFMSGSLNTWNLQSIARSYGMQNTLELRTTNYLLLTSYYFLLADFYFRFPLSTFYFSLSSFYFKLSALYFHATRMLVSRKFWQLNN